MTYDTDPGAAEALTISVLGNVYTFASSGTIDVATNVPGLTVAGSGTATVTVQAISGLAVELNTGSTQVDVASTNVATAITVNAATTGVTLGSSAEPLGLGVLTSAVTVSTSGVLNDVELRVDDSGASPASAEYALSDTTLTRAGFGGLTYSGVTALTLLGATTGLGGSNTYTVTDTADGVATFLDDSTNPASTVFTILGTSAVQNPATSLTIEGGAGTSIFGIGAAASALEVRAGTGMNLMHVSNAGTAADVTGAVTVANPGLAPFQVILDHSSGVSNGDWNLEMTSGVPPFFAQLTGFSAGGSLRYIPEEVDVVSLLNGEGLAASLTIDFSNGNPLPIGSPLVYDGGWTNTSTSDSNLILIGSPVVGIASQRHTATGPGAGEVDLLDENAVATEIIYTGLSADSLYDTVPAATYTFDYAGDPSVGVLVLAGENSASTGNFQTIQIASAGDAPEFVDTHVANKTTVVVELNDGGADYAVTVNYAIATPVAGLATLRIVSGSGDDQAELLVLPPGAATTLQQGGGADSAYLSIAGTAGATSTSLDGGGGVDTLTIDADGLPLTPANFTPGPGPATTISGAPLPGAPVVFTNYEQVTVTAASSIVPTVFTIPIHTVEGQQTINVPVGAFLASAAAKASDFGATIDWGDGTTTAGVIVQDASNPSVYYVYGTHTYHEPGSPLATAVTVVSLGSAFTIYVGATPITFVTEAGDPVTTAGTAFVADAPIDVVVSAFSGTENNPIAASPSIIVATFTDQGGVDPTDADPAADYTATIYWGDGTAGVGALEIIRDGVTNRYIVTAAPHTYATPGSYVVTIVVDQVGGGTTGIATGVATIADAPLTATASQPANPVFPVEGFQFVDWAIGSFDDANPLATVDQYEVTIDWGDGSAPSLGRVVQPSGPGTTFYVLGTHTYANSLAAGAHPYVLTPGPLTGAATFNGTYPLTIAVQDTYGSAVELFNSLTVADRPLIVQGGLAPDSDSGLSKNDGITNVNTPTFRGTASEGGARVYIYASSATGPSVLIGSTTADSTGAWSLTPDRALGDGTYAVYAQAYDSFGHTISAPTVVSSSLTIDTVGPKVSDLVFDNYRGQVLLTFVDKNAQGAAGVGMDVATARDANNYRFSRLTAMNPNLRRFLVTSIEPVTPAAAGESAFAVRFNNGAGIRGGRYLFRVLSAGPANLSGVQDLAGNALDGEYYGFLPAGNDVRGGDLEVRLSAIHRTIHPPATQVGTASPIVPPGTPATGRSLRRDGALLPSASSAVRLAGARRPALAGRATRSS